MASAGQWRNATRVGPGRVGQGAVTTGSRPESSWKWFMDERFLGPALTTGVFCAFFAMFVATVTDALALWQVAGVGGASGFLGSLFASFVWRRK